MFEFKILEKMSMRRKIYLFAYFTNYKIFIHDNNNYEV